MTTFIETPRFPTVISFESTGGPRYLTVVVKTGGGDESRDRKWSYPLHQYDAVSGIKTLAQMEELLSFFHVAAGRALGFRYKDFADFKSCAVGDSVAATDQTIGTGDAAEDDYQLIKTYSHGAYSRARIIAKPVAGTTVVSLDDVAQGSGWSVDTATGIITFDSPPGGGVVVKAGYEFDVPCRFETDTLSAAWAEYEALTTTVPITEVRL